MANLTAPSVLALAFGTLSICYGLRALTAPENFATEFGHPIEQRSIGEKSNVGRSSQAEPFIAATGGRTIALGLAILVLALEDQINAAGTVIASCAFSGLSDAMTCYAMGRFGPMLQHAAGCIVLATLGIWLRSK